MERSYRLKEPDSFIDFGSKKGKKFVKPVNQTSCNVYHVNPGVTMEVFYKSYDGDNMNINAHQYDLNLHGRLGDIRNAKNRLEKTLGIKLKVKK